MKMEAPSSSENLVTTTNSHGVIAQKNTISSTRTAANFNNAWSQHQLSNNKKQTMAVAVLMEPV
jgi:hypothetical protein